ncbi:MAG: hypothetical protein ABI586_08050, partial [Candidatus Nanopelagicales bacterium]
MTVNRWRVCALVAMTLLAGLVILAPAQAKAPSDPYISSKVPVPAGCIVLGRAWAGVKVFLVQRRL